jgi:hypothetical protein
MSTLMLVKNEMPAKISLPNNKKAIQRLTTRIVNDALH